MEILCSLVANYTGSRVETQSFLGALVSGTPYPHRHRPSHVLWTCWWQGVPLGDRGYLVLRVVSDTQILPQSTKLNLVLRQLLSPAWEAGMGERSRDNAHGRCIRNHLLRSAEVHKSGSARLSAPAVK